MIARHVVVAGRVQGVGFRWHTQRRAESLGLTGWVRNRGDGTVEAHVEGSDDAVDRMLGWFETGPGSASVTRVTTQQVPVAGHSAFVIRG